MENVMYFLPDKHVYKIKIGSPVYKKKLSTAKCCYKAV